MSSTEHGGGIPAGPPPGDQPGYFGTYQPAHDATYQTYGNPATDVLATPGPEPEPRRAPWAVVALVGALVLALVGGVSWAVGRLAGGGSQPEDALPSGAVAFVKVDLDPSFGQKIDGFRFLRKFPALRDQIPLDGDVREVVFDAVADEAGWEDIDYERDVEPWLGDRLAIAVYHAKDHPMTQPVVALQVTDEAAAEAGLRRLVAPPGFPADGGPTAGFVITGDYALLAETQDLAARYAARAEEGTLAADADFAGDFAAMEDGVAAVWVDNAAVAEQAGGVGGLTGGAGLLTGAGTAGRSTMVARFDGPDVFEVVGSVSGADAASWATHPLAGMGDLPDSSVAAFGLADGEELVPRVLDAVRESMADAPGGRATYDEMIADVEAETGLRVPEDLALLLGDNAVAALDRDRGDGVLQAGAVVTTDAARATKILAPLVEAEPDVVIRAQGDRLVVATSPRQADRLTSRGPTLGEADGFSDALPDLADADAAIWVHPAGLMTTLFGEGDFTADADPNLEAIDGIGVTMNSGDDGTGSFRFRIVAR